MPRTTESQIVLYLGRLGEVGEAYETLGSVKFKIYRAESRRAK